MDILYIICLWTKVTNCTLVMILTLCLKVVQAWNKINTGGVPRCT